MTSHRKSGSDVCSYTILVSIDKQVAEVVSTISPTCHQAAFGRLRFRLSHICLWRLVITFVDFGAGTREGCCSTSSF